jgi:hypothetical protein
VTDYPDQNLTFFLCRERDDMTALLASKGQQLWMRPNVGLPAVQFHRPLAQFAAGWCKACFRGSSHFLSLDLGSLIATMGSTGFEPTVCIWPTSNKAIVYVTGDIPVGVYDSTRLSNIGIGHGAVDAGFGYTYLNPKTGQEFSGVLGAPA